MNKRVFKLFRLAAVACFLSAPAWQVQAQGAGELPSTIRIVVPYPAGGPTDFFARVVSNGLKDQLKSTSSVENRSGAGGVLGSSYVAKAAPDGGTLLLGLLGPLAIGPAMSVVPFDPLKELAPIRLVATVTPVMIVSKKLGVKNIAELVAMAKADPGKLNFASAGRGSLLHLLAELLKREASIDIRHVPYAGGAAAVTAIVTGEMDILFADAPVVMPFIESGDVIAIAVTSDARDPSLPKIPTFAEAGLPGMTSESWYGILAPAGTPSAIVNKLAAAVTAVLETPEVRASFEKQGAKVPVSSPAQFSTYLAAQVEKWGKVAKDVVAREK
jgi:tripartite-type tricarboxylate transporter receptor subunit TctC